MRKIDILAVSAGLIASVVLTRPIAPPTEALATETWLLEQGVEGAFVELGGAFEACYAATLPHTGDPDARAHMLLASTCSGAPTILLV